MCTIHSLNDNMKFKSVYIYVGAEEWVLLVLVVILFNTPKI